MSAVQLMCDVDGALVGFSILTLDCESGVPTYLYQAVDSTSTTSTIPAGWQTCCTEQNAAGSHPMYTDPADLTTHAGYVFIRHDNETDAYEQQYVTTAGAITTTLPSGWFPGACGAVESGAGTPAELDITDEWVVIPVLMAAAGTANITWTDMPLAEDFFNGSVRYNLKLDCTKYDEARLVVRKMGTAGAAAAKIIAQYSTVNPGSSFTGADWNDLGTSEISCAVNVTNQVVTSSWVALAAGAKDDVYLTIIGSGGDGATDPIFGNIYIEFRQAVVGDVDISGTGGGGGGGVSAVADSVHLYLSSSTVLNDTFYPDWGQPGLAEADRIDNLSVPCGYSGGDWCRMVVTVFNVTDVTTEDIIVTLKDLTNAVDVGTVTIASGSSPTGAKLREELTIGSGSFTDDTDIQWHIESVQDDNAFGLHAEAFYLLTPDAT